jgi:hypothetical protein
MKLVRVRGTSKQQREPTVLGVAQFHLLLEEQDIKRFARWLSSISPLGFAAAGSSPSSGALGDDLTFLVREASLRA